MDEYEERGSGITYRFIKNNKLGWFVLALRSRTPAQFWQSPYFQTRDEAVEWMEDLDARENDD